MVMLSSNPGLNYKFILFYVSYITGNYANLASKAKILIK